MQLTSYWRNAPARVAAVALVLAFVSSGFGLVARTPAQSEPVKKTQPAPETQQDKPEPKDQAIKLEATLVTVPVIASDRDGRYIPDMTRQDFTLQEDGGEQEIVFFATVNGQFHVVLMLDTSASTQDKLGQIKSAAFTFIEQLKPADRVKVISFDDSVRDLCEFTNERSDLRRAIDRPQPGRAQNSTMR